MNRLELVRLKIKGFNSFELFHYANRFRKHE